MKFIYFVLIIFLFPIAFADGGMSGGGGGTEQFTYSQCNDLLNNKLTIYENATKKADGIFRIFAFVVLIYFILLLIGLGMNIQQIKDKGIKEWWKSKKLW
ncbi:hypothetical protein HY448_01615 [Candidatus Pacearchaeota archaeon]|nr:hypothetical protein [Candidatus Pacearchaeota archaeon]